MTDVKNSRLTWHEAASIHDAAGCIDHAGFRAEIQEKSFPSGNAQVANGRGGIAGLKDWMMLAARKGEVCMTRSGAHLCPQMPPDDGPDAMPVLRCLTGGSVGAPIEVRRTHQSWIRSFHVNQRLWNLSPDDRYAVLGDLSHSLSLYAAVESIHLGAQLHLVSDLNATAQLRAFRQQQITVLYATPAQIGLIDAAHRHSPPPQVRSLRLLLIGGAKLPSHHRAKMQTLFPQAEIWKFYGSAETSFVSMRGDDSGDDSVGQAYPGVDISIVDADASGCGRIAVTSPYTSLGYGPGTSGSADWCNGAVITNDIGVMRAGGDLALMGRGDRRIKIADRQVCVEEIETCILRLSSVSQVAVVPVADTLRATCLVAFIQAADGNPRVEQVRDYCREKLDPLARPRRIIALNHWPLLPSGKTDYGRLRARLDADSDGANPISMAD
ncbi:MAG: AMP-binding protein [Rhodobacteraceae bacterium]|nr:AMP-binding protein [Paracoccaceae bacterium]MCY4196851.1 AMP-binding protein [Paracoccaceae bacterium]